MTTVYPNSNTRPSAARLAPEQNGAHRQLASLTDLVRAAVEKVEDGSLWHLTQCVSNTLRPKAILAILTYCYASQIYGSAQIQRWLLRDGGCQAFGDGEPLGAREIQMFREQNRSMLHTCLSAVLAGLAGQKVAAGIVTKINNAFAAEEARRRLIMAAYIDQADVAENSQADENGCLPENN